MATDSSSWSQARLLAGCLLLRVALPARVVGIQSLKQNCVLLFMSRLLRLLFTAITRASCVWSSPRNSAVVSLGLSLLITLFSAHPQRALADEMAFVDVYYGDTRLVSTLAAFSSQYIRFEAPDEFLHKLPDTQDHTFVHNYFRGNVLLSRPGVCSPRAVVDCFESSGERIVVTFDPEEFRVELFIAPGLLTLETVGTRGYLPAVRASPSYLATLDAIYTGNRSELQAYSDSYNFAADQVISTGSDRLHIYTGFNSEEQLYFRDIAFVHEFEGNRLTAGRYDIRGDRLTPGALVWGVGVESTADLRLDLEQSGASKLELFLARDSRVDIYRDGRLLSSRYYALGNRQLDVSELPEGAYEVTIQVIADGVLLREERRYFAKSTKLPPVGENQFSFDIGRVVDQFKTEPENDAGFIGFGYARRMNPSHFVNLRSMANAQWRSLQVIHSWILPRSVGEVGAQVADDGYYAHDLSFYWQVRRAGTFSVEWFKARAGSATISQPIAGSDVFRRSSVSREQIALRHSLYRQRWSMYSTVRWDQGAGERSTVISSTFNFFPFADSKDIKLSLSMSDSDTEGFQGNIELQWQFPARNRNYWFRSRAARGRGAENEHGAGLMGREGRWMDGELRYELSANARADRNYAFGLGNYRNSVLKSSLGADIEAGGNRSRSLNASLSTAVTTAGGRLQLFASEGTAAGVVASVPGEPDQEAEIVINDRRKVRVRAGSSQFILLEPYQQYSLRLNPLGATQLDYDQGERLVTLYPGRVPVVQWQGRRLVPAFGQIRVPSLADGAILQLRSGHGRDVVGNGDFFALDVDADSDTLVVEHVGKKLCSFELAEPFTGASAVVDLGELYCEP